MLRREILRLYCQCGLISLALSISHLHTIALSRSAAFDICQIVCFSCHLIYLVWLSNPVSFTFALSVSQLSCELFSRESKLALIVQCTSSQSLLFLAALDP